MTRNNAGFIIFLFFIVNSFRSSIGGGGNNFTTEELKCLEYVAKEQGDDDVVVIDDPSSYMMMAATADASSSSSSSPDHHECIPDPDEDGSWIALSEYHCEMCYDDTCAIMTSQNIFSPTRTILDTNSLTCFHSTQRHTNNDNNNNNGDDKFCFTVLGHSNFEVYWNDLKCNQAKLCNNNRDDEYIGFLNIDCSNLPGYDQWSYMDTCTKRGADHFQQTSVGSSPFYVYLRWSLQQTPLVGHCHETLPWRRQEQKVDLNLNVNSTHSPITSHSVYSS